ncbi:MAG TPA: plastocyanin/azurin family copper-binding protein [Solirubrobacteraceae bacterium]|nr:plastocyanin/azurin family copper-binding protein [Solirubrobacteraceae bacterium]
MRKIAIALAALSLVVAGCGGDDEDTAASNPAPAPPANQSGSEPETDAATSTVNVAADPNGGLTFEPTELTAKAGSVTLDFTNGSQVPHDVVVQKGDEDLGRTEVITDSETEAQLDLAAGSYTYYCSVPGHLEAGMKGTLTVE